MRASTRREFVAGPAGKIECAVDEPEGRASRGVALVAHPHPLFGGALDNKVAQTLARAFVELGYTAWRPNFRGVGASEGTHDEGRGEVEDLAAVLKHAKADKPVLAGFSFGAAVQTKLAQIVTPERMALVGVAVKHLERCRYPPTDPYPRRGHRCVAAAVLRGPAAGRAGRRGAGGRPLLPSPAEYLRAIISSNWKPG
jgi:alpha/beta superfamily hydrolase